MKEETSTTQPYLSSDEGRYRPVYAATASSPLMQEIWREVYKDDYPEGLDFYGFVTVSDLEAIASELALTDGQTMLDIGCGRGGPGLWVAKKAGAKLVGMDIVEEAVAQAQQLKLRFGMPDAEFRTGSFTATGLPDQSVDGVMSIDVYWMVQDKRAAVREMQRILRPGARFAMTTWAPKYLDPATTFSKNGFEVLARRETPDWRARQLAVYERIRERKDALVAEMGEDAMRILVSEAENAPAMIDNAPRVIVVAKRL